MSGKHSQSLVAEESFVKNLVEGLEAQQAMEKLEAALSEAHEDHVIGLMALRLCQLHVLSSSRMPNEKVERFAKLSIEAFIRSGHAEGALAVSLWVRDFAQNDSLSSKLERVLVNSYGRQPRAKASVDEHLPPPTPFQEFKARVSIEDVPHADDLYRDQLRSQVSKGFPLFANLKAAEISRLIRLAEIRSLNEGKYLFKEGERPEGFYILASGRAELVSSTGLKKEIAPGDFLGDLALFASFHHTAAARALEGCDFVFFARDTLLECFKTIPRLREELTDLFHHRLFLAQSEHSLIFSMIDRDELEKCWEFFVPIHVSQGHILMEPGMFADRFFLILRGKVEVQRKGKSPVYLGPGHFVGERGLILNTTRNATLTTLSDCDLLECDRWSYQELLQSFPDLATRIEERRPDYENYQFSSRNFVID